MSRSVASNQNGESKFTHARRLLRSAVHTVVESLEQRRLFAVNPVAVPGGPYVVNEGSSVLVSGLGSTDDGSIVSYQWDTNYSAGRGFRARFTGSKFNFVASDSGVKTIALRVTDNDGNASMATTTVTINDVAPTLSVNGPNNAAEGQTFSISWSYTDPGYSDVVTAWQVDWGDGSSTTVAGNVTTASHAYAEDGVYQIELTATQADATTSVTHNITIDNESPQVNASSPQTTVDEGETVAVNFNSPNRAGTLEEWVIDWGDGNIDMLPTHVTSYTHTYNDSGVFVATIRALEPDGGTGSATVTFNVNNVDPIVSITGVPAAGDEGQAISVGSTVTDAGSDDTHTYGWTVYRDGLHYVLPGGADITNTTFSFTPTDNGSYVIRLTVLDDDGGSTTVNSDPIIVANVDPTAVIGGAPVGNIDEGTAVNLTATPSDDGSEDTFTYSWSVTKDGAAYTLPDGTDTTSAGFSFTPRDDGSYIATVVVTDDDGGSVTVATAAIAVDNADPVASIVGVPVGQPDEGDTVPLSASVTDAGVDDTHAYSWSVEKDGNPFALPGGTDTTSSSFAFVPTDNGDYVVTLVVTDDDGGTDVVTSGTITVNNLPPIPEISGDTAADEGDTVNLTSSLTDRGSDDTHTYSWSVEKDGQAFVLPGGTDATSSSFAFIPTDNGSYVVTLTVTDDDGASATVTHTIAVANLPPSVQQDNVPATGDEGTPITIDSTVSDAGEDDTLTYGWTVYRDGQQFVLPGGTTIDGTSFTFTPTDNGSYVVRLTVVDDDSGSTTVNSTPIIVANVDPTAVISGEPVGNIDEGTPVNLSVTPSDAGDEDTFSYSWSVTKDGHAYDLTGVDTDDASFSFTPDDNGTYIATVVVTDDDGGSVSVATAAIVVDNVAPDASIIDGPVGNVNEGDTISVNAFASDPGTADTFTYAWSVEKDGQPFALPGGTDATSSSFAFIPTDNGDYVITLTITDDDGGSDTTTSTTITVDNVAPTGSISGDDTSDEGSTVNYSFALADPGSDDTHTYSWSVEKDGQAFVLPGGTDTASSSFAFVPTDNGDYAVTVVVTDDDGGTNTYTHNLSVENVAPTPSITGAPATSDEGATINLGSSIVDPGDDDTHTYSWSVTKDGQAYGAAGSNDSFSFTPDDNGTYVVTLETTDDDGATGTTTATITVNNVAAVVTVGGEPVGNIDEGTTVNLTTNVTDVGTADTHTYSWTITKDGQAYVPGVVTTNSTLSFAPGDNGTYVATVTVTDDDGATTSVDSVNIVVDNVDPVGSITGAPVGNVDEGDTISLGSTVSDAGTADTHTYAWSVEKDGQPFVLPGGTDVTSETFSFVPTDNGDYVVTLVVTDDDGGTDTITTGIITVDNVAPAPVISGDSSVDEASSITLSVNPTDAGSADTHTFLWSVEKDGQPFVLPGGTDTTSSSFTFTPPVYGNYVVSVTVTDDDGASNTTTHNLTVNNLPPVANITGLPSGTRAEGYEFNVDASAADPGGDTNFTYAWSVTRNGQPFALPGGTVTNTDEFSFEATDNGVYRITVAVTDSGGATGTSTTSGITITNANPNGTINNAPASVEENTPIAVDVTADDPGSEDTLAYVWSVKKDGHAFALPDGADTTSTNFTFTPTDNGTYVVSVVITDDDGGFTTVSSSAIDVTNANPTASITGEPFQSELEGLLIQLIGDAQDASPLDTLTYAWSVTKDGHAFALPGGTVTNASTFNFVATDNGTYVATLIVTDDDGGSVTVTSDDIIITNANPTATVSGPASVVEGSTVNTSVSVTDAGTDDTHTYLWSVEKDGHAFALPGGADTTSDTFSFIPTDNGDYVVTVVVTDDDGGSVTATHNVTVTNANPTAVINGPATGTEGSQIDLTLTVADAGDDDTHTYAWTVTKNGQAYTSGAASTLSFTPDDEGAYEVSITVTDDDGGSVTATKSITVYNVDPVASITNAPVGSVAEGSLVQLGSTASDVGVLDTLSYAWSVTKNGAAYAPSGLVTNLSTFEFTPDDNGSYVVTLVVSDNTDGQVSVSTAAIAVANVDPTPSIDSQPVTGTEGDLLTFSGSVADPGSADTHAYAWTVAKDGHAYAVSGNNGATFSFVPDDNGTYVVRLTVTDDDGGTAFADGTPIIVDNEAPTGSIAGAASVDEGSPITLTAVPSDAGSLDTFTYTWSVTKNGHAYDLGATAIDGQSLTFTPDDDGDYVATVIITDKDGASTTVTHNLDVDNVSPSTALTGVPSTGSEGSPISAGSTVSDPGDDTLTYGWTIRKDGTPIYPNGVALNGSTITFTPTDNGTYTLRLTVTDEDGGSTTVNSGSIVVANVAPSVAITGAPANVNEGTSTTLGSTVTDAGADDETAGFTYLWTATRGGQTVATGANATFDFAPTVHGTYTITLRATDKDGSSTTTTATTIEVDNVAPSNATISGLPQTMTEAEDALLTGSANDASGDTLSYSWLVRRNGNDFAGYQGQQFAFDPHARGTYEITLTVTDSGGLTTTQSVTINVSNLAPEATIAGPSDTLLLGETATIGLSFADVPSAQQHTVTWNFGDGSSPVVESYTGNKTGLSKTRTYAAPGTYTVSVTINDGVDSTVVQKTVIVSRAAVRTDPLDSTKTALIVLGTTGNDTIAVDPSTAGKYKVTFNGVVLGTEYQPTGRTVITGSGGNDYITVTGGLNALVKVGAMGSTVITDAGNDIIIGGPQADYLKGGTGRDIIVGGLGRDTILGGDAEDVIVADAVAWAANDASIKAAADIWFSPTALFASRIAGAKSSGLFGSGNLIADGVQDQLYGEAKGDWFVANLAMDRIRDYQAAFDVTN